MAIVRRGWLPGVLLVALLWSALACCQDTTEEMEVLSEPMEVPIEGSLTSSVEVPIVDGADTPADDMSEMPAESDMPVEGDLSGEIDVDVPSESSDDLVVGGTDAPTGRYPYLMRLFITTPGGTSLCGASLIRRRVVLTAAHCVQGRQASALRLAWGSNNLQSSAGPLLTVSRILTHPSYNAATIANDIALLYLPNDAPAQIPLVTIGSSGLFDSLVNRQLNIMGWGRLGETANIANNLQHAAVPRVWDLFCRFLLPGFSSSSMFCAGPLGGGKDACNGDSGGPVVYNPSGLAGASSNDQQVGIVSWGVGCARRLKPGVYTRLVVYTNWINANV